MKVFCDTNVLVAAFLANHPQHASARPVLERVKAGTDKGFVAAHSLAESYAVLTRLPGASQVSPSVTWQLISENIIKNFDLVPLSPKEYSKTIEDALSTDVRGGKIYDALLLTAAIKSGAERIYTFNVAHFLSIAPKNISSQIVAP
jgi:predicted nucleic acid-binding protein